MASVSKTRAPAHNVDTRTTTTASKPEGKLPAHERIATRAHEIWEARGCPQGQDQEIWYQAERELSGASSK